MQTLRQQLGDRVQRFRLAPRVLDTLIARPYETAWRIDALQTCQANPEDRLTT